MNLEYLRYVVEIADCRSLNPAAEHLGLSQPNLSRAMKKLQDEVGFAIFERTTKGLSLTPEGEEFLFHARKILMECHEIEVLPEKKNEHRFSLSAPYSPYLDATISLWLRSMPVHQRSTFAYTSSGMVDALPLQDQLGIIRIRKTDHDAVMAYCKQEQLVTMPLLSYSFHIIMSRQNPCASQSHLDLRSLKEQIAILEGSCSSPVPNLSLTPFALSSNRILEWRDFHAIQKTLQAGNAYWITMPWPQVALDRYDFISHPLLGAEFEGEDILVYRSSTLEIDSFIKTLKSEIAAEFRSQ